jgi:hypothetical protein
MLRNSAGIILLIVAAYLSWTAVTSVSGMVWIYAISLGALAVVKYIEHRDTVSGEYSIKNDRYVVLQAMTIVVSTSLSILLLGHSIST